MKKLVRNLLKALLILFFLAGFGLGLWRFSWLVFLAATAAQILLGAFLGDGK